MDTNESLVSKESQQQQQQPLQYVTPVPSWIDRLVKAGVIGGSESNIKQLEKSKKTGPQHKSDILIAQNKTNERKNLEYYYKNKKPKGYEELRKESSRKKDSNKEERENEAEEEEEKKMIKNW